MKKPTHALLAITLAVSPVAADNRDPAPAPSETYVSTMLENMLALFGIARPRTLANGAPACGNVQTKGPPPAECREPAAVITAEAEQR